MLGTGKLRAPDRDKTSQGESQPLRTRRSPVRAPRWRPHWVGIHDRLHGRARKGGSSLAKPLARNPPHRKTIAIDARRR